MYTKTAGNEHQINLNSNLESRNIKGKMSIVSKCIRERVLAIFFERYFIRFGNVCV